MCVYHILLYHIYQKLWKQYTIYIRPLWTMLQIKNLRQFWIYRISTSNYLHFFLAILFRHSNLIIVSIKLVSIKFPENDMYHGRFYPYHPPLLPTLVQHINFDSSSTFRSGKTPFRRTLDWPSLSSSMREGNPSH